MKFKDIRKGMIVRSVVNRHSTFIVLDKHHGWVVVRPTDEGCEDMRFNCRAKILWGVQRV